MLSWSHPCAPLLPCSTGFDRSVLALCDKVVAASSSIYHTISKELLPTPAKPHYTFNLRDLGKVFQVGVGVGVGLVGECWALLDVLPLRVPPLALPASI